VPSEMLSGLKFRMLNAEMQSACSWCAVQRERESMGKSDRKNKFTSVITVVEVLRVVEVPVPRQNLSPVRVFRSDKIRTI
jgi:hypothetical protein